MIEAKNGPPSNAPEEEDIITEVAQIEKPQKQPQKFSNEQILKLLFDKIGHPTSFDKIVVNNVFLNNFRVNIFISGKISSYFLTISNDGKIVKSTPNLDNLKKVQNG